MPLDAITLSAVLREIEPSLLGAKIDKVQQPERDTVILSLRGTGGNSRLLICAGTGSARIHFTETAMENPPSPPMFCMLLRKHLTGARITAVSQPNMDRLAVFDVGAYDELGNSENKRLIVEMMGRSANIILVGEDGRIIDCLHRTGSPTEEGRAVLPGLIYREPPVKGEASLLECSDAEIALLVNSAGAGVSAERWLTETFFETSPLISKELLRRASAEAGCEMGEISGEVRGNLVSVLAVLRETARAGEFSPYMIYVDARPRDFSFMTIGVYGEGSTSEPRAGFSELFDEFYANRDKEAGIRRRSAELMKAVKNQRDRRVRTLENQRGDLKRSDGREELRRAGDLITANIYRLKKGDTVLETEDYYDESGESPIVKIALDTMKTPQQNSAVYYKKYSKLKTAQEHLIPQIERGELELAYLNSVIDELERAESGGDIAEIRRELVEAGYLKAPSSRKKDRAVPSAPLLMKSSSGFEMKVGRNNKQNDNLTFREASKRDIWMHTQKIHGSHVIIKCGEREPDDATIYEAAMLAARYSATRGGGKVSVDYTRVRNVKKTPGSLPGMVIYTDFSTIIVDTEANGASG